MKLSRWLKCYIFWKHEWTCKVEQGEIPTKDEIEMIDKFWKYAKMYCKHCGKKSRMKRKLQMIRGYKIWKEGGKKIRW